VFGVFTGALVSQLVFGLLSLANLLVNICYLGGRGQTLGKKVAGVRLVRQDSGQPVGFGIALGRAFLHIADALPLAAGFFAPLWDEQRRTFADKIIGTLVIKAPAPGPGYPQQYGQPPHRW
jgi:uncharacterized RDD family membrane protein YckC